MPEPKRFPLEWPREKQRTPVGERRKSAFAKSSLTYDRVFKDLDYEVERVGGTNVVLSMSVPLRVDGRPRGDATVIDPGVCLYMTVDGMPLRFACDKWLDWRENVRAITVHLEAMRAIERYGVGDKREVFSGYTGLARTSMEEWRVVLGFTAAATVTRADVEAAYRERARDSHPDHGGSDAAMARLNAARDRALSEVR